jgi:lipoprotein-releasing system ATP-binding protein
MSDLILNIQNLKKSFVSGDGSAIELLKGISLEVSRGQSLAICGSSGCGKSTLLNLIGTLESYDSGLIEIEGRDIKGLNEKELAAIRLSRLGFVFQKHHLLPQLSALENVLLPTLKSKNKDSLQRAKDLLARVGLTDRASHRPGQLSGGECQRVALCRALINKPALLLADEPTGALDPVASTGLTELMLSMNKEEQLTLVTVTHSAEVASKMGLIYRLENGLLEKV